MLATIGIQPSEVSRILNLSRSSISQLNEVVKYQSRTSDLDNKYHNAVENSDLYQARDFTYENIDLSTLDDNELEVYNRRGWANELFTKEDRVLLKEKFNELNSKSSQRTDNVLGDGSRVVEVNNKIVLIGGTFEEPIIHGVFAINAVSETYTENIKEFINYAINEEGRTDYEASKSIFKIIQDVYEKENIRYYDEDDYFYNKREIDTRERATLPSGFQHYGYTKQFQDGTGVNTEAERSISNEINSEKYQERYDPMSNRELLANALETTAKTSMEKSK